MASPQTAPRRQKWLGRLINSLQLGLIMLDLNPLVSEPVRFGSLFAAQAIFQNVLIAGLVFGLVTLALDVSGAIATAHLLEKKLTLKLLDRTHAAMHKLGLGRLLSTPTGLGVDFSITLLVGTPITLIVKQRQDATRSREANITLGISLSVAASVVSAAQGTAIVAGLWHPSSLTIVVAILAIVSLVGLQRWLRRRFN